MCNCGACPAPRVPGQRVFPFGGDRAPSRLPQPSKTRKRKKSQLRDPCSSLGPVCRGLSRRDGARNCEFGKVARTRGATFSTAYDGDVNKELIFTSALGWAAVLRLFLLSYGGEKTFQQLRSKGWFILHPSVFGSL